MSFVVEEAKQWKYHEQEGGLFSQDFVRDLAKYLIHISSWNSVFSFLLKFGIFQSVILSGAYGAMDIIMILGVYPNLFGNNQAEMAL